MYIGVSGANKLPIASVHQGGLCGTCPPLPLCFLRSLPRRDLRHMIPPSVIRWLKVAAYGGAPVTPTKASKTRFLFNGLSRDPKPFVATETVQQRKNSLAADTAGFDVKRWRGDWRVICNTHQIQWYGFGQAGDPHRSYDVLRTSLHPRPPFPRPSCP